MRKKRILFNSNHSRLLTGFGKNTKNILTYLHKNGYEVLEYASQMVDGSPPLQTLPWQARGALPNDQHILNELNKDQGRARAAAYGEYNIESVVKDFKPDVCFFVEDAWSHTWAKTKNFWKHTSNVLWVTQDSKPLIHAEEADATKHYWTWADFARKDFHKLGKTNVKTQYPPVDLSNFYNLGESKKKELRKKFNIPEDVFVIGDTSRNQLRKFTNLIEGYATFRRENPNAKTILLLVTNFSEGWDIPRLAQTYGIDMKEIWTAYVSNECGEYLVHPFIGQDQTCPFTKKEKALHTVNITKGLTEEQLNETYNLMDLFLHSTTSGGLELTTVEAAACEVIVSVPDYSYGEDIIELNKGALKLDWAKALEIGTQFEKSHPFPSSIAKQIKKAYNFDKHKRAEMGKLNREWAKENYDLEKNCKQIADFIDSLPFVDWDNIELDKAVQKNENYQLPENYKNLSDDDFLTLIYKEILLMEESPATEGHKYWQQAIKNGQTREQIYAYFINVAKEDNRKQQKIEFGSLVDKDRPNKRACYIIKESLGDVLMNTQLFEDFHNQYKDTDLYVAVDPKFFEVLEGNPYVYKVIPYQPFLENEMIVVGAGQKKEDQLFHYFFHPCIGTQRQLNYLNSTVGSFDLKL